VVPARLEPERLARPVAFHAQGPAWDPVRGRVLSVDAPAGRVLSTALTGETAATLGPDALLAGVQPRPDGTHVVVGARALWAVDPEGPGAAGGVVDLGLGEGERARTVAAGPGGHLLVAASRHDGGAPVALPGSGGEGRVLRVAPDGAVELALAAVGADALCLLADGSLLVADAGARRVERYAPGAGGPPEPLGALAGLDGLPGAPAGLCADAEGGVWVALWGAGRVVRVDLAAAAVTHELSLPVLRPTGCALVGGDGRTLVVTTSAYGCPPGAEPDAGALFAVQVDVAALGGEGPT